MASTGVLRGMLRVVGDSCNVILYRLGMPFHGHTVLLVVCITRAFIESL